MRTLLAVVAALAGAAAARAEGCGGEADAGAVAAFVAALGERDAGRLAAVLPREGALTLTGTIETPWLSDQVPPERLAAELREGAGVHGLLLDGGPDDDLADYLEGIAPLSWVEAAPGRFEPRGGDGRTFLRVLCEGGRPVIAEIGWPAA